MINYGFFWLAVLSYGPKNTVGAVTLAKKNYPSLSTYPTNGIYQGVGFPMGYENPMGYWNSNYPIGIPMRDLIATQRSGVWLRPLRLRRVPPASSLRV